MILGMKDAVKDEEKSQLLLDHSLWIDVPGKKGTSAKGNNDHYVAEQGEVCLRLILAWMGKHREKEDTRKLYVISPFTTVVKGIKAAVKAVLNTEEYSGLKGKFKGWETANCGTVHKFQGKEAEEVIFLLGCQPSSTGAIGWVNINILTWRLPGRRSGCILSGIMRCGLGRTGISARRLSVFPRRIQGFNEYISRNFRILGRSRPWKRLQT